MHKSATASHLPSCPTRGGNEACVECAPMFLSGPGDKGVALCYSMNVHPGEGLDDVLAALGRALETTATSCLEIETYTWDVLPLREGALLDSLEAEYRYVLAQAADRGFRPAAA